MGLKLTVDKIVALKFLSGTCTPEERLLMEEWLTSAENKALFNSWVFEDYSDSQGEMPGFYAAALKNRLDIATRRSHQGLLRSLYGRRRAAVMFAAAACILLIVSVIAFYKLSDKSGGHFIAEAGYRDSLVNSTQKPLLVHLPDGSSVWLNNDSKLFVAGDFNRKDRRVKLVGEGYFDIHSDNTRPFLTEAGGVTTRVLGTAYNIEAYANEPELHISLASGKVNVSATDSSCMLTPGQMAIFSPGKKALTVSSISVDDVSAWTKGLLVMNNISLPEALHRLSTLYGMQVSFDEKILQQYRIAGEFRKDSLPRVLSSLLYIHGLKYNKTAAGYQVHR